MFRNCTGGVHCKECICTTLGPGALSSPSSQETVLAEGPHEAESAKESSGEPAMPICAPHIHMHTHAPFQIISFCQSITLFFFILYSFTPNIYPTVFAYGTVTGSHVHETWYHSPGCSDWKNKEKLAPSSVPMSGFHAFFLTLKPQRSKSTHTHTD